MNVLLYVYKIFFCSFFYVLAALQSAYQRGYEPHLILLMMLFIDEESQVLMRERGFACSHTVG